MIKQHLLWFDQKLLICVLNAFHDWIELLQRVAWLHEHFFLWLVLLVIESFVSYFLACLFELCDLGSFDHLIHKSFSLFLFFAFNTRVLNVFAILAVHTSNDFAARVIRTHVKLNLFGCFVFNIIHWINILPRHFLHVLDLTWCANVCVLI